MHVKPKKRLGQHFLTDENIAKKIVNNLSKNDFVVEIGPGTGVLTKYLMQKTPNLKVIEIDKESVAFLETTYPEIKPQIINADFLQSDISKLFVEEFAIIGNFPYNISSQIFFKIIHNRHKIPEVVGMIQKEVAERLTAPPGNKTYGILTVILGAFYEIKYLFTVSENVFNPPPRIKSAVVKLIRKENFTLNCNEKFFMQVVKTAFNQRRKTLRNSLKGMLPAGFDHTQYKIFTKRPEQLDLDGFIQLTDLLLKKNNMNNCKK